MNFVNTKYLPYILVGSTFLFIVFFILNRKYFAWVKSYWFLERSWMSRISSFFYGISLLLMLISLLDLRGPEERVKSSLPDQKTIIILDSSASMLAEDVRPSRFGKAIQLARHFVKNAAGHQIAIVLFSDIQKRLIPFTDDIDLLDSRLAALEKTNSVTGGSNISQAIAEAVGYFEGDKADAVGNILVFTDAEESEDSFDLELGNSVNLAVVGIGTAKGANIPLRWEDGSFRGYKTVKGEPVTTRLDEEYIKKIGKKVKSYKYWIANSYSLPTDDIMNFFRGTYNKTHGKGDVRIRPVFSHFILIPAIFIYCFSVLLGRFASFKTVVSVLLVSLLSVGTLGAQDEPVKQKELPASLKKDIERMKSGKADRKQILKVAEGLLKNNQDDKARELYAEYTKENDDEEVLFNRATSLLKTGKFDEALPLIQQIYKSAKSEDIKNQMRHNVKLAMNNQSGGKSQNKENKDQKEDKDGEGDNKDQKEQDEKDGKDQKDNKDQKGKDGKEDEKSKDGKSGKDGKEGQDKNKGDSKDKNEDKKDGDQGDDPKDLDKPQPEKGPKDLSEKEKMIESKRKMIKTPAMVKQIMNDDRELQKRMMDTSTNERGSSKPKRDW